MTMSMPLFVLSPALIEADHEDTPEQVMLQLFETRVDPASEFACLTRASYLGPVVRDHVGLRVYLVSSHLPSAHRDDHVYLCGIYT
jgi:hypothetical protein